MCRFKVSDFPIEDPLDLKKDIWMLGNEISNKDQFIPNQNLKLQAKQKKIVQKLFVTEKIIRFTTL